MDRRCMGLCAVLFACVAPGGAFCEARTVQDLDAEWRFHLGDVQGAEAVGFDDSQWRVLDLPHDWSVEQDFSQDCASGTGYLPGGIGWYRRSFTLSEDLRARRVFVEFDGVYRNSDVWINGVHLGHRPYGYIGFQYDLTPHVRWGRANCLAVRVAREDVADSRWYTGTGIYRHVRLVHMDPVHVAPWGVFVTTPRITAQAVDAATTVEVANDTDQVQAVRVLSRVLDPNGTAMTETVSDAQVPAHGTHTFADWQKVPGPRLWSVDTPILYTLVTQVFRDRVVVDEIHTRFGIRTFHFDPDEGFFLNGKSLKIKGLCMHHDGGVVGAAVPAAVLERRLRLAKDLGANAIRCSHNPMAPELYDLCDRLGLLVMDEAFDEWEIGKRKWVQGRNKGQAGRFGYAEAFEQWAERDAADMVRQHRNHPSIILWSIGNEIDYPTDPYVHPESRMDPDFKDFSPKDHPSVTRLSVVAPRLIAAVKQHDPTRPVTMALANVPAANGTGLAQMLDVVGYNYQEKSYEEDHRLFPGRVLYGSENGKSIESWRMVRDRAYVSALFLWVGFDFLGEAGQWPSHGSTAGVFDRCGFVKSPGLYMEALWKDAPVLHMVTVPQALSKWRSAPHWTWDVPAAEPMVVQVYANTEQVELLLNGRSLGIRSVGEDRRVQWDVPYAVGELVAIGRTGGREQARVVLRTAGRAARIDACVDRVTLSTCGVAHVVLQVVDADGIPVPDPEGPVVVEVRGAGRLLGLDNGNQSDPTPLRSTQRRPVQGRLLALVQAGREPGDIVLTCQAQGLKGAEVRLRVEQAPTHLTH